MSDTPRRAVLRGAGALACYTLGGSLSLPTPAEKRRVAPDRTPVRPTGSEADPREDFLWLPPGMWRDRLVFENAVAFAARHDLAIVFSQGDMTKTEQMDLVVSRMAESEAAGATPWFATAIPYALTPREFVEDAEKRERHLSRLRSAAQGYADVVPDGNLVIWEEAPVAGEWIPGGAWNGKAVDALTQYGPELYARQRAAVADVAPDLSAGIFLHFPYVVEQRRPEVFANLMDDLAARDSLPDFVFTDFYRGWWEKDAGPAIANAVVRSLVTNAARHSRGRPVYFLGQAHTINPRHTPSTQAMRMDLRAATAAGARGIGWYARTAYKQTRRGFDPFVPNELEESAMPNHAEANTLTFARDRFLYAYRATLAAQAGVDPRTRFDLWIHTDSPGFYGHRVSVQADDGWTPLGDVAGAHPAVASVDDDEHVSVFHALDAERFLADGSLSLRVETHDGHDGRLRGVYALPFDPAVAYTERDATRAVGGGRLSQFAHWMAARDDRLTPDSPLELTVRSGGLGGLGGLALTTTRYTRLPVADLLAPGTLDHRIRLASAESDAGFDRRRRFDLWVRATGGDDPTSLFDQFGLDAAPVTAAVGDGAAVFWGLRRRVLGGDAAATLSALLDREFDGATVDALYAMPYFGSEDLRLPAQVAPLLRESAGEVATFSFAHARRDDE
ncbi:hypothetical protein ACFPYI_06865 [Halomarina salina]|uniref:Uncharacterized protein n=1 Tax=Halomarina salina TaxID=1872699 RepID=A0ABD5RKD9_9EURY|nr:hypothetical protein [Halomarina salina]